MITYNIQYILFNPRLYQQLVAHMPLDGIWNRLLWQVYTEASLLTSTQSLKETTEGRGGGGKGKDFLVYFAPSRDYQAAGFTLWKAVVEEERETLESGRKRNGTNFLLRDSIVISAQGFPRLTRNFTEKLHSVHFCLSLVGASSWAMSTGV